MYLVYLNKPPINAKRFLTFVLRRWLRIAPAFYAAAIFCAICLGVSDAYSLLAHALFLHTLVPHVKELAAPFWSIATEMHFYLVLPVFAIIGSGRKTLWTTYGLLIMSVIFGVWLSMQSEQVRTFWSNQLPVRLCEFCWGILVGIAYSQKSTVRSHWAIVSTGAVLLVLGRLLMMGSFANGTQTMRIMGAFGVPLLSGGYAALIWSALNENYTLNNLLNSRFFQVVGRYSYSLYLWHWIPSGWMASLFIYRFGKSAVSMNACFITTMALLLMISAVSYTVFEQPYFRYKSKIATA